MSDTSKTAVRLRVDPTNPGQFFACCGMLELADRLWGGAVGWFDRATTFCVAPVEGDSNDNAARLVSAVAECPMDNTMTPIQRKRREELSAMTTEAREADPELAAEKKELDAHYRESSVVLGDPFHLVLDWFFDERAGGKAFKTWAGQQSVIDIAKGMKGQIDPVRCVLEGWLFQAIGGDCLPFNFDSDLGGVGSAVDVGFSFDPLKDTGLNVRTRPLLEFGAFVGLQRFRPQRIGSENEYEFSTWREPLQPEIAATAACGAVECLRSRTFRFRLLYRTKYLKSFLPAMRV
ncbi:MAG: type I-U CRISPR-associated protein Cas8c [Bryobacteraceae bacterium]